LTSSIQDLFKLEGRVAIVTGATRGLGLAMTGALLEAGAQVLGVDRGPCGDVPESLARPGFSLHLEDVSAEGAAERIVAEALGRFGRLDILVNNAGIIRRAPFLEFSEADWDDVMDVNLKAVFRLSQAAARVMAAQGSGKLIQIASMLSFQGGIRVPSYTASKSGVAGLTRLMACELGPLGIQCNALAPGYMATDNTEALRADPERSRAILDRIPAGRWGEPSDLAGAVVFLASRASDYVNGHILAVDGGWLAR